MTSEYPHGTTFQRRPVCFLCVYCCLCTTSCEQFRLTAQPTLDSPFVKKRTVCRTTDACAVPCFPVCFVFLVCFAKYWAFSTLLLSYAFTVHTFMRSSQCSDLLGISFCNTCFVSHHALSQQLNCDHLHAIQSI